MNAEIEEKLSAVKALTENTGLSWPSFPLVHPFTHQYKDPLVVWAEQVKSLWNLSSAEKMLGSLPFILSAPTEDQMEMRLEHEVFNRRKLELQRQIEAQREEHEKQRAQELTSSAKAKLTNDELLALKQEIISNFEHDE